MHGLFYYDISQCNSVASATLYIYVDAVYDSAITLNLHIVTSTWSESTNWNNGPSFDSTVNTTISSNIGWNSVDITKIAQDWENGDLANHGIKLRNDGGGHWVSISSRETSSDSYVSLVCQNPPSVDSPVDISYFYEATGNTISWTGTDDNPSTYSITRNGTLIDSNTWSSGNPITINVDDLTEGIYFYEITLTDLDTYSVTDTVKVTVLDPRIVIDGNTEFFSLASTEGWTGNGTLNNPIVIENYQITPGGTGKGISVGNSTVHFIVSNVTIENYSVGIFLENVTNGLLVNNTINNNGKGIVVDNSTLVTINNNLVISSDTNGIEIFNSNVCALMDNNVTSNTLSGIVVENSYGTNIELNNVSINGDHGVKIVNSTGIDITYNSMNDNMNNGIIFVNTNSSTIKLNQITDNNYYGVFLNTTSKNNTLFQNVFISNYLGGSQARDDGINNSWFNPDTLEGNFWDDYQGTVDYNISGTSNAKDLYPLPFITINKPVDFSISYGAVGYTLTWTVFVNPLGGDKETITLYRNGSIIQIISESFGNWTNIIIESLDSYEIGNHNFTLVASNSLGIEVSETTWIRINAPSPDIEAPVISTPDDIQFEQGSIGYFIIWNGTDDHPYHVIVLQNGSVLYNQSWIGEELIVDLGKLNLEPGTHNFTCIIYDFAGNFGSDMVFVTVDPMVPDTDSPIIYSFEPIEYIVDAINNYLTLNASDSHPLAYEWFLNNTIMGYYPWHGEVINISIDHLGIGTWIISITVYDLSRNTATENTTITVLPTPPDLISPSISFPAPLEVFQNQYGTIIWEVKDEYPGIYVIYKNQSTLVKQGSWSSGIIQLLFLGQEIGIWEYNLTIWDVSGNQNSSVVIVTVLAGGITESDPPVIASLPDMTIIYNTTGNSVTFHIFDESPSWVEVYLNNSIIFESLWTQPNEDIFIFLDGIEIGTYKLTLLAIDFFDNRADLTIDIAVIGDTTPPVLSSPETIILTDLNTIASIDWAVSDDNLHFYEIYLVETGEILTNESLIGKTSETIHFTVTRPSLDNYTVRIIVYDTYGHRTVDDVQVTVQQIISGSSTPGFELFTLFSIIFLTLLLKKIRRRRINTDQPRRFHN
jgi:hypothetical protein